MARVAEFGGDVHVSGGLSMTRLTVPAGALDNDDIASGADIDATKLEHQYAPTYQQTTGADVAAATQFIHVVKAAGTLVGMDVVPITVPTTGDRQYSVDLQKGNAGSAFASVLSAAVTIGQTDVDRTPRAATISNTTLADGDVLKIVVTLTTGSTGNQGLGVVATVWTREGA